MYRWRTRETQNRIAFPSLYQIRFELFLARSNPRRIVFFRDPNASMAEQDAHPFYRCCGCRRNGRLNIMSTYRIFRLLVVRSDGAVQSTRLANGHDRPDFGTNDRAVARVSLVIQLNGYLPPYLFTCVL